MKPNKFRIEGDVVWIELTQGKETCIDLADWECVRQHRWWAIKNYNTFYAESRHDKVMIRLHNFILRTEGIDHEDRNGLNNRRNNLRPSTQSKNLFNTTTRKSNSSGCKGVYFRIDSNKWAAQIRIGENKRL